TSLIQKYTYFLLSFGAIFSTQYTPSGMHDTFLSLNLHGSSSIAHVLTTLSESSITYRCPIVCSGRYMRWRWVLIRRHLCWSESLNPPLWGRMRGCENDLAILVVT